MKVLVKNFRAGGDDRFASLDENYVLRQNKIIEMYRMLIALYKLTTARKQMIVKEKAR
jgi:hypothetical protein